LSDPKNPNGIPLGFLFYINYPYNCNMNKLFNVLFTEINNAYYQYLFVPANRRKLLKLLIYCFLGFSCFMWGYKWRDAKIIIQNIQIGELSIKKNTLKQSISDLNDKLHEYNFMLSDGDYYRYLAFKYGEVVVPKETAAEDLMLITEQAKKYKIPFKYIYRLIWKESRYDPTAKSSAGASGYMQVMPATFRSMKQMYEKETGNDLDDLSTTQQNIMVGTYTINYLYKRYNDWKLTFAAYNAGSGNVNAANGIPNIPETQAYVKYITSK